MYHQCLEDDFTPINHEMEISTCFLCNKSYTIHDIVSPLNKIRDQVKFSRFLNLEEYDKILILMMHICRDCRFNYQEIQRQFCHGCKGCQVQGGSFSETLGFCVGCYLYGFNYQNSVLETDFMTKCFECRPQQKISEGI